MPQYFGYAVKANEVGVSIVYRGSLCMFNLDGVSTIFDAVRKLIDFAGTQKSE